MDLNITFDNTELAKEFAQILRDENIRGVGIEHQHKQSEQGSLASPELIEMLSLAVNPLVLGTASTVIISALKTFFNFKIKEKEENIKEVDRRLALEMKKLELASKERIEAMKTEIEMKKLEVASDKIASEEKVRIMEAEFREETERIKALANRK